jgi:hypothetical protein
MNPLEFRKEDDIKKMKILNYPRRLGLSTTMMGRVISVLYKTTK